MTIPVDLEGSLFFAEDAEDDAIRLFDELKAGGHHLGLSSTSFEYKAPFVRTGGREVVGERAIRAYFRLSPVEADQ